MKPALETRAAIIGYDPMEIYTNKYCVERKLVDKDKIEIIGKSLTNIKYINIKAATLPIVIDHSTHEG